MVYIRLRNYFKSDVCTTIYLVGKPDLETKQMYIFQNVRYKSRNDLYSNIL